MIKRLSFLAAAALIALAGCASQEDQKYVTAQVPTGGSRYATVLIPVSQTREAEAPYALTGRESQYDASRRMRTVWIPQGGSRTGTALVPVED